MANTKVKYQNTRILVEVMDVMQDKDGDLERKAKKLTIGCG
jgi:hypothetical protein